MMSRFYDFLPGALAEGQPFALGIISGIKGSSPQKKGAKALFLADGRIQGTLGGGCLEAEIQDRARRALLNQAPASFELVLDHDFGWDDGLICGGKDLAQASRSPRDVDLGGEAGFHHRVGGSVTRAGMALSGNDFAAVRPL